MNNSNDNHFSYTKVQGGWAGYNFGGSGTLFSPDLHSERRRGTGSAYGLVMPPGDASSVEIHSPWWDVEIGGTGTFKATESTARVSPTSMYSGDKSALHLRRRLFGLTTEVKRRRLAA